MDLIPHYGFDAPAPDHVEKLAGIYLQNSYIGGSLATDGELFDPTPDIVGLVESGGNNFVETGGELQLSISDSMNESDQSRIQKG